MENLQIFKSVEFGEVRTLTIKEDVWFVGKDVTNVLGYQNSSEALQYHVDGEDKLNSKTLSSPLELGQRGGWLINESGLYSLILSSKLPTAKSFKRWVTSEVLPSIRKKGSYSLPSTYKEALLALVAAEEEKERLLLENEEMKLKADYFDDLVDKQLNLSFRDTAKELQVKEKEFLKWLKLNRYIYKENGNYKPYSRHTGDLFVLKEFTSKYSKYSGTQTLVTVKGRETFRLLLSNIKK